MPPTAAEVERALADVGLAHLSPLLDETERWDQVLGNGERQRLCLARVLVHQPDVIVLDDALAALDEAAQVELETRILARLPGSTLISLSQRPRPTQDADARLQIDRNGATPRLEPLEPVPV